MKRFERFAFAIFLLASVAAFASGLYLALGMHAHANKWLASAGLLLTIAGVFQLDISGLFDKIVDHYGDEQKYPGGPPSYITRQIIDNPDSPVRTWLRNTLFFNAKTGLWLIVTGTVIELVAVWV